MPSFGRRSTENLSSVHPLLIELFEEVVKKYDCSVLCGHRNEADQMAAYNSHPRRSKCVWPESKHNSLPSLAVDVAPYPIDWDDLHRFRRFAWYVKGVADAKGIPIRMGADWDGDNNIDDQTFHDTPHFELDLSGGFDA